MTEGVCWWPLQWRSRDGQVHLYDFASDAYEVKFHECETIAPDPQALVRIRERLGLAPKVAHIEAVLREITGP